MRTEVFSIFPTPVLRIEAALDADLVAKLVALFEARALRSNSLSTELSHTELLPPASNPLLQQVTRLLAPHLVQIGQLMFGEALKWSVKELWVNVLDGGGRQAVHNHANSFVSGVVYLTHSDASSSTTFAKSPGGHSFAFDNSNSRSKLGPFSAGKWMSPSPSPGDVILFPSYLLHEVPVNRGARRITLAFNAIPERLDAWGYSIRFSP